MYSCCRSQSLICSLFDRLATLLQGKILGKTDQLFNMIQVMSSSLWILEDGRSGTYLFVDLVSYKAVLHVYY